MRSALKFIAWRDRDLSPAAYDALGSIHPEGVKPQRGKFDCDLPFEDERVARILACLAEHGCRPWPGRVARLPGEIALQNGEDVQSQRLRSRPGPRAEPDLPDPHERPAIRRRPDDPGDEGTQGEGETEHHGRFRARGDHRAQGTPGAGGPDRRGLSTRWSPGGPRTGGRRPARSVLGVGFPGRPAADGPSDAVLSRHQRGGSGGRRPPPFVYREGHEFPAINAEPAEGHYLADAWAGAPPFDLARTHERPMGDHGIPVASPRLYRVLAALRVPVAWIPVRID